MKRFIRFSGFIVLFLALVSGGGGFSAYGEVMRYFSISGSLWDSDDNGLGDITVEFASGTADMVETVVTSGDGSYTNQVPPG